MGINDINSYAYAIKKRYVSSCNETVGGISGVITQSFLVVIAN